MLAVSRLLVFSVIASQKSEVNLHSVKIIPLRADLALISEQLGEILLKSSSTLSVLFLSFYYFSLIALQIVPVCVLCECFWRV